MATTPSKYRSSYTGAEIQRLLSSISSKLDSTVIRNDFTGGTDVVASAELAKILNDQFQQFLDPNFFRDLVASIPDNNLFTDADKAKLESVDNTTYKGVFLTPTDRNTNLPTTGFTGKEVTFLLDDGSGLQSWDYWDTATNTWKKAKLVSTDEIENITFPTVGTGTLSTFDRTEKRAGKYLIYATKGLDFQAYEFLAGTNGTDTYISAFGEVGNAQLFNVAANISGNNVNITVTTLTTSVTVSARRVNEF